MKDKNNNCTKLATLVLGTSLLTGCFLDKDKLVTIGDAENLLFTDNGRLIATGGKGIYEITNPSGDYEITPLYTEGVCNFTGIAQKGDWLFAACNKGLGVLDVALMVAPVSGDNPIQFQELSELNGFFIANGIDFNPQGDLLIANYNIIGVPALGLSKLALDLDALPEVDPNNYDPTPVIDSETVVGDLQHNWLPGTPNGVRIKGNKLFTTEGGSVYRYELDEQGEVIDQTLLTSHSTIFDDLYPLCDGAIVTDFLNGRVFYVEADGYEDPYYKSAPLSFSGPSAVAIPQGNLFASNQLIVTEKGVLLDNDSNIGNRVSAVNLPFNVKAMEDSCN